MMPSLPLSKVFSLWETDILTGTPPVPIDCGCPIPLFKGQVIAIGAPPGQGKTCLVCGWVFNALATTGDLKAVIANCEMSPDGLLERELTRVSGVPLDWIQSREFPIHPKWLKR